MKRRTFLAAGLSLPFFANRSNVFGLEPASISSSAPELFSGDQPDEIFLQDLQRRCYQYFLDAAHPKTLLVSDRASTDGSWFSPHASSAACGFAMAAHCVAANAGWSSRGEAAERVRLMLRSLLEVAEHENGFVYHFFDAGTGRRGMQSEVSSIDTALMLTGAMTAATTFSDDPRIVELSDLLYRRVDWQWMLGSNDLLHMGWTPESGMLPYQWDRYSELIILVMMAIGAPSSPIPPRCWNAWRREPVLDFNGEGFLSYPPLFVHQYPFAFFDFRDYTSSHDRNFFRNAVHAHRAQIAFMSELGRREPERFGHYGENLWGLTSSDSADGYRDWGGPYETGRFEPDRGIDGTIVPSAAAGGLAIVPAEAMHTLRYQLQAYGDRIYGRYGFVNAYNPVSNWVGPDVIGIDTGISLLMAENLRTGGVWDAFMQHPAAKRAMAMTGFTKQATAS
ncbi:MAG: glucoamylase family protein [Planctomycetaceae bacterium]